VTYNWEILKL